MPERFTIEQSGGGRDVGERKKEAYGEKMDYRIPMFKNSRTNFVLRHQSHLGALHVIRPPYSQANYN